MNQDLHWSWQTHQPLIRTILSNYKPEYILEIGIGLFSTPLFVEEYSSKKYLGIDNDFEWFSMFKEKYPNSDFIFHEIQNTVIGTKVYELQEYQKASIIDYYQKLRSKIISENYERKLLFVDNYTCARTFAINNLHDLFDIVILHDTEPAAYSWYSYYFDNNLINNYVKVNYETGISWTTAFIKKSSFLEDGLKNSVSFIQDFEHKHGIGGTKITISI
jgi:hypothetical protein